MAYELGHLKPLWTKYYKEGKLTSEKWRKKHTRKISSENSEVNRENVKKNKTEKA